MIDTTKMIKIQGILFYKKDGKNPDSIGEDRAETYINLIAKDAVYGSFGNFPKFWDDKWEFFREDLCKGYIEEKIDEYTFRFIIYLSNQLFPVKRGGLQHLISTLGGDLFERNIDPKFESIKVETVEIPEVIYNEAISVFREPHAHNIDDIIKVFRLDKNKMPFLAFSFKPRAGIYLSKLEEITIGVLKEGFNLVELDTRNLAVREEDIKFLVNLARKAANLNCNHVTRFSPNLSVPSSLVVELAEEFVQGQDPPVVIKIDGGLDGISACQAIRQRYRFKNEISPIITCYPLLRKQLRNRITDNFFVQTLALSGANIIYPGGRPDFKSFGGIGVLESDAIIRAVRKYREMYRNGWPLLTIAGGVHAGDLHAFYTLFGQKVAYFLGGAVALHHQGPIKGAKLCVRIFEEAVQKCRRPIEDLPANIVSEIESAYQLPKIGSEEYKSTYISPSVLFSQIQTLIPYWENH